MLEIIEINTFFVFLPWALLLIAGVRIWALAQDRIELSRAVDVRNAIIARGACDCVKKIRSDFAGAFERESI
jgi:hypothetical protein